MPLPPYALLRNPRARNIILKVLPRRGLVVVLPPGTSAADARDAVDRRRDWIADALARLDAQGLLRTATPELPERLTLPAIGLDCAVLLLRRPGARSRLERSAGRIAVTTGAATPEAATADALRLLRRLVTQLAKTHLPARLRELSRVCRLPYAETRIRAQRRRWGSCSAANNIQLNCKLLFLPPELVDHVLIHELCHTRRHDHGPEFHALLARLSPDAKALERRLTQAGACVPAWMEDGSERGG
jgi:predicted metal-dependent hydrolase